MIQNITYEYLEDLDACQEAIDVFLQNNVTDAIEILTGCVERKYFFWANWLVVRLLDDENKLLYAIFTAETIMSILKMSVSDNTIEACKESLKSMEKCIKYASNGKSTDASIWAARAVIWSVRSQMRHVKKINVKKYKEYIYSLQIKYGINLLKKIK